MLVPLPAGGTDLRSASLLGVFQVPSKHKHIRFGTCHLLCASSRARRSEIIRNMHSTHGSWNCNVLSALRAREMKLSWPVLWGSNNRGDRGARGMQHNAHHSVLMPSDYATIRLQMAGFSSVIRLAYEQDKSNRTYHREVRYP